MLKFVVIHLARYHLAEPPGPQLLKLMACEADPEDAHNWAWCSFLGCLVITVELVVDAHH